MIQLEEINNPAKAHTSSGFRLAAKAGQVFVKLQESFVGEALLFRRRADISLSNTLDYQSRAIR